MEPVALSVSELTRRIKAELEGEHGDIWVEGEVSNYRGAASSGHRYFSLKDEGAQLKAVLFKGSAQKGLNFELQEGQLVLAHGRLSVYEPRGDYQLVADRLEPKGVGALQMAFEQLKRKLEAEGLFDAARKRALPRFPRRVLVITSPGGAVIRDILNVCARRTPWIALSIMPVRVQGEGAAQEIANAIRYASEHLSGSEELLLLARGGGSIEDLWAFNEEVVARAIAASKIPVISAVGHEVDFTIADFVADLRAPTPSAAAEILSASGDELRNSLGHLRSRAAQAVHYSLDESKARLESMTERLQRCHPRARIEAHAQRLDDLKARFSLAAKRALGEKREAFALAAGRLQALSPLAILARGYAACFDAKGRLLRRAQDAKAGEKIELRLGQGSVGARVEDVRA